MNNEENVGPDGTSGKDVNLKKRMTFESRDSEQKNESITWVSVFFLIISNAIFRSGHIKPHEINKFKW